MSLADTIYVIADWVGLPEPMIVGALRVQRAKNKEVFDFTYDKAWLQSGFAHTIDPKLQLYEGPQFHPHGRTNFGVFLDSSPDRWGRTLMQRREAHRARSKAEHPRTLLESDFLLGVHDLSRSGGLRFATEPSGPFLDNNHDNAAPPFISLRTLEHASLELESKDLNPRQQENLVRILAPGSSLGGARPKASVIDENGHLWIAKFPSSSDRMNIGAWEYLTNRLAELCAIRVPNVRLEKFTSVHHTLLSRRFDRTEVAKRVHFASAMTLLDRTDGDDHSAGVSYLDIAEMMANISSSTEKELEELWRRMLFNVLVSNTDDHLRNHGFLLVDSQWVLSPAYDMNPVAFGTGLQLNISEHDNSLSTELVLNVASYFRLSSDRAQRILRDMVGVVSTWDREAERLGIPRSERLEMSNAFRLSTTD